MDMFDKQRGHTVVAELVSLSVALMLVEKSGRVLGVDKVTHPARTCRGLPSLLFTSHKMHQLI